MILPLQSGTLNRRISIQSLSTTQDQSGEQKSTYSTLYECWGGIHAASGKEVYAVSGFVQEVSHIVTIRYNPAVALTNGLQILYEARTFRVQAISDPDESRQMWNLVCLEVTA